MSDHERQGRHLKFSKPGPRFWGRVFGRVFGVHDRVHQLLSCTPPSPLRKPSPSLVSRFQPKYADYYLWEKNSEPLMGAAVNFQIF